MIHKSVTLSKARLFLKKKIPVYLMKMTISQQTKHWPLHIKDLKIAPGPGTECFEEEENEDVYISIRVFFLVTDLSFFYHYYSTATLLFIPSK